MQDKQLCHCGDTPSCKPTANERIFASVQEAATGGGSQTEKHDASRSSVHAVLPELKNHSFDHKLSNVRQLAVDDTEKGCVDSSKPWARQLGPDERAAEEAPPPHKVFSEEFLRQQESSEMLWKRNEMQI